MTASAVVPQHPQIRRKAKIVCTLGPASSSPAVVRELIRSGMDVARLNFSHGTHEEKARLIATIREVAASESRPICILQDLQGPKIRTGRLKYRTPVALKAGSRVTITPKDVSGTNSIISTTFKTLAREVQPGARILLSDGLIELHVRSIQGDDVECEVVNGGILGEHKGINLPGTIVSVPSLTEKDEKDLEFGLAHGVDIVAVSFIRTAADVQAVREKIRQFGGDVWVVAKLEKPQAIEHLEEILEISDSVMVARGDLGVEMPPEKVPIIQKHVIRRAAAWRKPVITATQMLESMIENPRPTRAEASDVANAIFGRDSKRKVSARGGPHDGQNRRGNRKPDGCRACSSTAQQREALYFRNHLRVCSPRSSGTRYACDLCLYRNGNNSAAHLKVSPQDRYLRVLLCACSLQSRKSTLGRHPNHLRPHSGDR